MRRLFYNVFRKKVLERIPRKREVYSRRRDYRRPGDGNRINTILLIKLSSNLSRQLVYSLLN
jgi:hypothetical protein